MAAANQTFWPSFPLLEAAFNTTKDGLWRFGLIFLGVLVDC